MYLRLSTSGYIKTYILSQAIYLINIFSKDLMKNFSDEYVFINVKCLINLYLKIIKLAKTVWTELLIELVCFAKAFLSKTETYFRLHSCNYVRDISRHLFSFIIFPTKREVCIEFNFLSIRVI